MKEKLKLYAKYRLAVVKTNKITFICFFLAISVALTGAASFAKYVSGDPISNNPQAAGFHNTAVLDGVSALSFTNMAFWGGLEEYGVSMNSLRTVNISVNNFEIIGGEKYSTEVKSEYSLIFEIPQNFAGKLALQLIGGDDAVLTPQMVLEQILNSVKPENPDAVFMTEDPKYNGKDYVGIDQAGNPASFITFDVHYDTATGITTATSRDRDGTIITVEPFVKEKMQQTLFFRLWDVEKKGEENIDMEGGGDLKPPLVITFEEDVPCYRITIYRPDFLLSAGGEETDKYKLTLAPIDALRDTHLGGYLMNYDNNGNLVYAKTLQAGKEVYLHTVTEVKSTNDDSEDNVTLMGSIPYHYEGNKETIDIGASAREYTIDNVYTTTATRTTISDKTDADHTKYYYYSNSNSGSYKRGWNDVAESAATYKIENWLKTELVTTTTYMLRVRETSYTTETITTNKVSADRTQVEQSVERTVKTVVVQIDVLKKETTHYEYSEYYKLYQRSSTKNAWGNPVNQFNRTFTGSYPESYNMHNTEPETRSAVALNPTEMDAFNNDQTIQNAIKKAGYLTGSESTKNYNRVITYTTQLESIIPTDVYTMDLSGTDGGIDCDPLNTHITVNGQTIQKYYISTSYSKNYPFYMKVHFEQIQ